MHSHSHNLCHLERALFQSKIERVDGRQWIVYIVVSITLHIFCTEMWSCDVYVYKAKDLRYCCNTNRQMRNIFIIAIFSLRSFDIWLLVFFFDMTMINLSIFMFNKYKQHPANAWIVNICICFILCTISNNKHLLWLRGFYFLHFNSVRWYEVDVMWCDERTSIDSMYLQCTIQQRQLIQIRVNTIGFDNNPIQSRCACACANVRAYTNLVLDV